MTALVMGTIAPDVPYFLLVRFVAIGHVWPWSFLIGINLSLVAALLWHEVIRIPFLQALPTPLANRFARYTLPAPICISSVLWGAVAAAIGIATHLIVDNFTHSTGYFVMRSLVLRSDVEALGFAIPLYKLLQYGLTLIGFIAIGFYLWNLRGSDAVSSLMSTRERWRFWLYSFCYTTAIFIIIAVLRYPFSHLTVLGVAVMTSLVAGVTSECIRRSVNNGK